MVDHQRAVHDFQPGVKGLGAAAEDHHAIGSERGQGVTLGLAAGCDARVGGHRVGAVNSDDFSGTGGDGAVELGATAFREEVQAMIAGALEADGTGVLRGAGLASADIGLVDRVGGVAAVGAGAAVVGERIADG